MMARLKKDRIRTPPPGAAMARNPKTAAQRRKALRTHYAAKYCGR